jgi:hypothetical protein
MKEMKGMTETGYLLWFIAMALATITVLTVGTLGAAELLPHQRRAEARRSRQEPGSRAGSR